VKEAQQLLLSLPSPHPCRHERRHCSHLCRTYARVVLDKEVFYDGVLHYWSILARQWIYNLHIRHVAPCILWFPCRSCELLLCRHVRSHQIGCHEGELRIWSINTVILYIIPTFALFSFLLLLHVKKIWMIKNTKNISLCIYIYMLYEECLTLSILEMMNIYSANVSLVPSIHLGISLSFDYLWNHHEPKTLWDASAGTKSKWLWDMR